MTCLRSAICSGQNLLLADTLAQFLLIMELYRHILDDRSAHTVHGHFQPARLKRTEEQVFVAAAGAAVCQPSAVQQSDFRRTGKMIPRTFHTCSMASLALISISTGCYHPYPHQQPYGYTQPGYAPGQTFSPQGAPGQLIIPPSNAPLYQPGAIQPGTINDYDNDYSPPSTFDDDFQRSDGRFFPEDGGVPLPKERNESDRDFRGTSVEPSRNNTAARTVSASQSYGY